MPYNMGGAGGEGSVLLFILALHLIFCCRYSFSDVYSKVKLELSLIFPSLLPLMLMLVNKWLAVSLLFFFMFCGSEAFLNIFHVCHPELLLIAVGKIC